jgi:hypothetical protein
VRGGSWFFLAALANFVGVYAHGVLGHRAVISPLRQRLFPTRAFGDEDMTWRISLVSWHLITVVFACSGTAFLLIGRGWLDGGDLPRFLGAMHLAFLLGALAIVRGRAFQAFRRPIPITFGVCMTTAAAVGLFAR